jgi:hypothetical protein
MPGMSIMILWRRRRFPNGRLTIVAPEEADRELAIKALVEFAF